MLRKLVFSGLAVVCLLLAGVQKGSAERTSYTIANRLLLLTSPSPLLRPLPPVRQVIP
jgi:hypothetical protein